jgi:hypothetical protein
MVTRRSRKPRSICWGPTPGTMRATCDSGTVAAMPVEGLMFWLSRGIRATSSGETRVESGYTTITSCE